MSFFASFSDIKKLGQTLARADMVFYLMPPLMILLVAGTWAQREIGLYAAHQTYFSSFIIWLGFVPVPGGYTLLLILSANLLLKFLFFSDWSLKKSGIILSHLGGLVLLIGGLMTALTAQEGFMVIPEGQKTPYVYDYHKRELLIFKDDALEYAISSDDLKNGKVSLPLGMSVENFCENCQILKREEHSQDFAKDKIIHDMAQFMALEPKPLEKEAEANLSGFSFTIKGLSEDIDGLYIAFEAMPKPIVFDYQDHNFKIVYGKQQRQLPFEIALKDFEKKNYPGMQMVRGFSSDVVVLDDGARWNARIEMNAPLRYKGYTFYQSSFDQSVDGETTVLSVVENQGRLFPYIGTFILALGLLLHLALIVKKRAGA